MRLVDFLISLLEAQAQTLQRLAALFGEDILMEMLESAGDAPGEPPEPKFETDWFTPPIGIQTGSPYAELAGAVLEFKLPEVLEFHLWAYPHYRAFIESAVDLNSKIQGPGGNAGMALVDEAVAQAQAWIKRLPIPPEFSRQAESAAHVPWLRFRTAVLKKIGKRPLGPVY